MFNSLSPEEVNVFVRNNPTFKLPKEVVFYSNRENLADCSMDNTKNNEGWLFNTNGVSTSYLIKSNATRLWKSLGNSSVLITEVTHLN